MANQQWGLTGPISMAIPTEKELKMNDSLLAELRAQNNFASVEDTEQRKRVLHQIQKITEELVRHVGKVKGLSQSAIDNAGGKVFTFGSYRLGVYGPGSDIDTLIVAPKHVTRNDFFEHFPALLEKMSAAGAIEEMTPVPEAHVPIIKLEYSGVSVDLIFCRLAAASVPPDLDPKDDTLLRGLDEVDLRSINGTRVTDEILTLVPEVKAFRHALRAIKLWAQRRAIYANVIGFPGGVVWAMLVARVCQLYPRAPGSVIVNRFFWVIGKWKWPQPVQLKKMEGGPLNVRVWNPSIYPGDKRHLMPIITPAYPQMCATHNITLSTKEIIQQELKRGEAIMEDIIAGRKSWKDLFQKHSFFTNGYKHYLSINSASLSKEAQQIWSGLVQSKVRKLVSSIDDQSLSIGVKLAHPFNKGFDRVHRCKPEDITAIVMGDLQYQVKEIPTETEANSIVQAAAAEGAAGDMKMPKANGIETDSQGLTTIHSTTFYIGLEVPKTDNKKLDISRPVDFFQEECRAWANYIEGQNFLKVVYTRDFNLPGDVFDEGEVRPAKKAKKSKAATNGAAAPPAMVKKRKSDIMENGVNGSAAKRPKAEGVTA